MASIVHMALTQLLVAVLARSAPFVLYTAVGRASSMPARLMAPLAWSLLAYAGYNLGTSPLDPLAVSAFSVVYFGSLALCVHGLARALAPGAYSPALLLIALAGAYVCLPSILVPGPLGFAVQLIGWEMLLASYSYILEVGARRKRGDVSDGARDCLFFLLVDPTLVYVERGRQIGAPALRVAGLLRCGLGAGAMFTHFALFAGVFTLPALAAVPLHAVTGPALYLQFVAYYLLRFAAGYAVHSGLASLQIGLMRLIGYHVPERYHYPFAARDVADFWRRWNTYVGAWARRYVFTPTTLRLRRSFRGLPASGARALAVIATFAVIGAAHDLTLWTRHGVTLPATAVFVFQGIALIASFALSSGVRVTSPGTRALAAVTPLASRLLLWHALIISLWFAVPGMSSGIEQPMAELGALVQQFASPFRVP